MKIALLSCTSKKKDYPCAAYEMYSESARFQKAYQFAKLISDNIFILSPKYGLLPEDKLIEPYDESLHDKNAQERKTWANAVLHELQKVADLQNDEFIILAGEKYREHLLPHLSHYWLPLKGMSIGKWDAELTKLIALENETNKTIVLHKIFHQLPRYSWTMIDGIPYQNGIYVMFEKGETFFDMDRIVRIGTHTAQDRLLQRLKNHFEKKNARGSIFRKNIGRTFLNKDSDPYLEVWEIDLSQSENRKKYGHLRNEKLEAKLEEKISQYVKENITFVCFPVPEKEKRLRLEEGMIATLNNDPSFGPSNHWFGLHSPIPDIARSGLWNRRGLHAQPLSDEELEEIKWLIRFGNERFPKTMYKQKQKVERKKTTENKKTITAKRTQKKLADEIRDYIDRKWIEAKKLQKTHIDLVSGEIHKQMGLKNKMPSVCQVMYKIMKPGDEILRTTPSGKSSTITIRYYLKNR